MIKVRASAAASMAAGTLLGAVLVTGGASVATSSDEPTQRPAPEQATGRPGVAPAAAGSCNGGKVQAMRSKYSAAPFSFPGTSHGDVDVPGTEILLKGPKRGTDTLLITFSAEASYTGPGWMGLEVHLDGRPVRPYSDNGNEFAFTSSDDYVSASAQFCTTLRRGPHKIEVKANTTGDPSTDEGWLDDYLVSVVRFD